MAKTSTRPSRMEAAVGGEMKLPFSEVQGAVQVLLVAVRYQIAESEPRAKRKVVGGVEKEAVARR